MSNMAKEILAIRFSGEATNSGEMPITPLATSLIALNDLMYESNKIANGADFSVGVNIAANPKQGSVIIELATSIWQDVVGLFNNDTANALLNLKEIIGISIAANESSPFGVIQLIQKVKGRPYTTKEDNGKTILLAIDDEEIIVSKKAYSLLNSDKGRGALQTIFHDVLQGDGIDKVSIADSNKNLVTVEKEDAKYFKVMHEEVALQDIEYDKYVNFEQISFRDDLSWKFKDGDGDSFNAKIEDESFLSRIKGADISFSNSDTLKVRIHEYQYNTSRGVQTKRVIKKVLEHHKQERI